MGRPKQLPPSAALFVAREAPHVYHHNGGLFLLDGRDRPEAGFESFKRDLIARFDNIPQLRWKLREVPFRLDLPYWVEDEHFSYDNHIRRITLPPPGDAKALGELVASLYSKHLDRRRPLWESWFIEGLPDRQFAVLHKLHHCMMDGQGAERLARMISDFAPDGPPRPIDPAISGEQPGSPPSLMRLWADALWKLLALPFRVALLMAREIISCLAGMSGRTEDAVEEPYGSVPLAHFNRTITGRRAFVFGSLSLPDIKLVKKAFGLTTSDVALAIVAAGLREYLQERDLLPQASLRAAIAISLRTAATNDFDNQVTTTSVTLGTDIDDPVDRLCVIAADAARARSRMRQGGSDGTFEFLQTLPPALIGALIGLTPAKTSVASFGSNLLVSDVRGSAKPIYMAGMRLTGAYPVGILGPVMGINFTCISYVDQIDFGVTLEPGMFPEPWSLIDGLERALADYVKLSRLR